MHYVAMAVIEYYVVFLFFLLLFFCVCAFGTVYALMDLCVYAFVICACEQ